MNWLDRGVFRGLTVVGGAAFERQSIDMNGMHRGFCDQCGGFYLYKNLALFVNSLSLGSKVRGHRFIDQYRLNFMYIERYL